MRSGEVNGAGLQWRPQGESVPRGLEEFLVGPRRVIVSPDAFAALARAVLVGE